MESFIVFLAFSLLSGTQSLNNGLARTPQMGWNSWNHFHCGVNDGVIRAAADAMVSWSIGLRRVICYYFRYRQS